VNYSGLGLCLGTGNLTLNNLTVPVGSTSEFAVQVDASTVDFQAVHDGTDLPFQIFYANWYEYTGYRELDIWAQGAVPNKANTAWILGIYIPEETYNLGAGEYPMLAEDGSALNFDVVLYTGVYDADGYFVDVWQENSANVDISTLTINNVCEECTDGSDTCDSCSFSVNVSWFALRGKISVN
jgi:hypothetical protein